MADQTSFIKQIGDGLENIFRFMLPGVCILTIVAIGHPRCISRFDYSNWGNLAVLAALAVAVGNVWYVFHRYSVHQLIDYVLYVRANRRRHGYSKWLADHIARHYQIPQELQRLSRHIYLRSAQIIFMFIICESAAVFVYGAEEQSFLRSHRALILTLCVIGAVFAAIQQAILFRVDVAIVDEYGGGARPKPAS